MKLPPDFSDLLAEFVSAGVEFVLIGGYAFAFHAQPRATKDLDVLVAGGDNLDRVARALAAYGASPQVISAVRSLGETEIAYLGQPPLRIDILRTIDGVATADVLQNAVTTTWDGKAVRIISLDDLITNKRAAGRPQDLADVAALERIKSKLNRHE
jgi:predicted nucleotidyltransferase